MQNRSELNLSPVKEAAQILGVSKEALYRKIKAEELPSFRFGRKILVDLNELVEAMRRK